MQEGTLHKTDSGWIVKYDQIVYTPMGNHDYKVTRRNAELPTHPNHHLWLKIFGEEDLPVCFNVDTIATGQWEDEVIDTDVAVLIACKEFHQQYTQD